MRNERCPTISRGKRPHPLRIGAALQEKQRQHESKAAERQHGKPDLGVPPDRGEQDHEETAKQEPQPSGTRCRKHDRRQAEHDCRHSEKNRHPARPCGENHPGSEGNRNREETREVIRVGEERVRAVAVVIGLDEDAAPLEDAPEALRHCHQRKRHRSYEECRHDAFQVLPVFDERGRRTHERDIHRHDEHAVRGRERIGPGNADDDHEHQKRNGQHQRRVRDERPEVPACPADGDDDRGEHRRLARVEHHAHCAPDAAFAERIDRLRGQVFEGQAEDHARNQELRFSQNNHGHQQHRLQGYDDGEIAHCRWPSVIVFTID
jgi:hypothetical protein